MKTRPILTSTALVVSMASVVLAASNDQSAMMAEMEKCDMCKHIAANPELMKNMTWETHKIDNGMLCVSTVPKEKMSDFQALNAKMKATMDKMTSDAATGKQPELCALCEGMAELMKSGAVKEKEIQLTNGSIHMMTSDDPAMVAKIHAEADKAIEMQKQMAQK
jgi:hypothetical protein